MNIAEKEKSKLDYLGIYPRCPFYTSTIQLVLITTLIVLGTVGIYFLNFWIAIVYLIYSSVFYFFAMPVLHCKYCYYRVKETFKEKKNRKPIVKLLPKDKWLEAYLPKHVVNGKKWGINFFILWFGSIILIGISLFLNFSIFALLALIGFIVVLAVMLKFMQRKVCPTCEIYEECQASF